MSEPAANAKPKRRRRRRWRIVLVVLIALVAVIAAGPWLASTGPGNRLILGVVNARLAGRLEAARLSVSWFGPTQIVDLRVLDPEGRETLTAQRATCPLGILGLLKDVGRFDTLDVETLNIDLYLDADGIPSLARVPRPRQRPPDEPISVQPTGVVAVKNITVTAIQPDGRQVGPTSIGAEFRLDTLSHLAGAVHVQLADGGKVSAQFDLADLLVDGRLRLDGANGSMTIATAEPIALGPVLHFAGVPYTIEGDATLNVNCTFSGGDLTTDYEFAVQHLREQTPGGPARPPLDARLAGALKLAGKTLSGKTALSSDAGRVDATFACDTSAGPPALTLEDVLAAIEGGRPIHWPELALDIDGKVDLVEIGRAVPSLLKLLPDVELRSGVFLADNLQLRGGREPMAKGRLALVDVAADRQGKRIELGPIELTADAVITEQAGLAVRELQLKAPFASVSGRGSRSAINLHLDVDLSQLQRDLGAMIDLGEYEASGRVEEMAITASREDGLIDLEIEGYGNFLVIHTPDGSVDLGRVTINHRSQIRMADDRLAELSVKELHLISGLGNLAAVGQYRADDGSFDGTIDLTGLDFARVRRSVKSLLPDDLPVVDGKATGQIRISRHSDRPADVSADFGVGPLRLKHKGPGVQWSAATASVAAIVSFDENDRPSAVDVSKAEATLDETFTASAKGRYDLTQGAFKANAELATLDANRVRALVREFSPGDDKTTVEGSMELIASASRETADAPVVSSGRATLTPLSVDGKRVTKTPMDFTWSQLAFDTATEAFGAGLIALDSEVLTFKAERIAFDPGELTIGGDGRLEADLAGCLAVAKAFGAADDAPEIVGRLTWTGRADAKGDRIDITGNSRLVDLQLKRDDEQLDLPHVTLNHALTLDRKADRLTVRQLELASELLSCELTGDVSDLRGQRVLALRGSYEGSWDTITQLLHQLAPEAKQSVQLVGTTGGPIVIEGPAHRPKLRPAFRDVRASTDLGWQEAVLMGITFGPAKISPHLAGGRVVIPATSIDALEGKVNIGGEVDLAPETPIYHLAGKVTVLDRLHVDRAMGRELLSRFNPLFSGLVGIDGWATMTTTDLVVPLSDKADDVGSGHGRLDLKEMTVEPSGLLFTLLQLGGDADPDEKTRMEVDGLDFQIRRGRIHYNNFTVRFPTHGNFDLRFHGSVGFDDTLDLAVSVPVRTALLEKLKVKGPILEYARLLEGARVDVPVKGSRTAPKLDFADVDIQPLIEWALEKLLKERAPKILEDILRRFPAAED